MVYGIKALGIALFCIITTQSTLAQGIPTKPYKNSNGIVLCSQTTIGNTFTLANEDKEYTAVDRAMLQAMVAAQDVEGLESACTSHVTDMSSLFERTEAENLNPDISSWDVSNVTNMSRMFLGAQAFNQSIGNWDVSAVTDMSGMFLGAEAFNQSIGNWDVSAVTDMSGMFSGAQAFNRPIGNWDVSKVTDMELMFFGTHAFNQPIGGWDVSAVRFMKRMFSSARVFNQPIGNWNVSKVSDMEEMFQNAWEFNQDLNNWNVSGVVFMRRMFKNATSFNGNIGDWQLANPVFLTAMFEEASTFNQDISRWDVSNIDHTNKLNYMFRNATSFFQDLSDWCTISLDGTPQLIFFGSPMNVRFDMQPKWGSCPEYISVEGNKGWRMLGAPTTDTYSYLLTKVWTQGESVEGAKAEEGEPNVMYFNPDTQDFEPMADLSSTMLPGVGFLTYFYAEDPSTDSGTNNPAPAAGEFPKEIKIDLAKENKSNVTVNLAEGNGNWTLAGNPFYSAINWDNGTITKTGITNVVYVYDHNYNAGFEGDDVAEGNTGGGYRTWNGVAGGLTNGIIPALQGFWVQNDDQTADGNREFRIRTSARVSDEPVLYKNSNGNPGSFKLNAAVNGLQNSTWFSFNESGSTGKDSYDALKLSPLDFNDYLSVSTEVDGTLYDINNLPRDLSEQVEFPLHIEYYLAEETGFVPGGGEVRISSGDYVNIPESWSIVVNDYRTGESYNLRELDEFSVELKAVEPGKGKQVKERALSSKLSPVKVVKEKVHSTPRFGLVINPFAGDVTEIEPRNLPYEFTLEQNYPNPFNPTTTIKYTVADAGPVKLTVYNMMGQKVDELVNASKTPGTYSVNWDASNAASGLYFYKLSSAGKTLTKRMVLIK